MRKSALVLIAFITLGLATLLNAQIAPSPTGAWTPTAAPMSQARTGAAAAALGDGSVLVTGGADQNGVISASVELYGSNGKFTAVAPMNLPRTGHTATWLPNASGSGGSVLVTGGTTTGGVILASAELYDPVANTWTLLPSPMIDARSGEPATPLLSSSAPGTSVLLSGGSNASGVLADLELFNPATQQFSFVGALPTARKAHAAAALQDGRVLLAGGIDANGHTLASTAIYDPVAGTVTAGPSLNTPRANATATTLLDGTVLIAGGSYPEGALPSSPAELNSAEIFDPVANTITPAPVSLVQARAGQQAFLLPNNNAVLLVGGTYNGADLASAELYTPWLSQFAATGSMSVARSSAAGAALFPLADGQLLVAGGSNQSSAELYGFPTLETNAADYAPGTAVLMSGTGWKPGESVTLSLYETPSVEPTPILTTTADANGNISDGNYAPNPLDVGVRYYATAVGATSGLQAQNSFTDGNHPILSVTATGPTGSGTVTSSDSNISCAAAPGGNNSGTCTYTYSANFSNIVLTANANPGYAFTGWTGLCTGTGTCTASQTGNGTFSVTATFTSAQTAPAITSASSTAFTAGSVGSFTVTATGAPTPTLSESGTLPTGVTFTATTGALSGTPAAGTGGTYTLTFTASNGVGSDAQQTFTLTVDEAPAITSANSTTFTVGTAGSFSVTGTGYPAPTFSETGPLPSGVTLTSAGMLSGTPTTAGSYPITLTASNGVGSNATQSFTLTVTKATPTITTWPTASAISYGQALSSSTLTGGASSTPGTFAFTTPSTQPVVGTASQGVTFTPTDTTDYSSASGTVSVTVTKATPTITTMPTASAISYGQALSSSTLSGGAASTPGTFAFTTPSTQPGVGTASQGVTFTPTDITDYSSASGTVSVTVTKATPTITTMPTASAISYGQALSSSTLSGGAASTPGTFAFTTPSTQPGVGTAPQGVTFTPTDITDYSSASGTVSVTVTKATPTITTMPTASAISYGQALSSSTLSGGASTTPGSFAFTAPTTQPSVGTASQGVTFTPTDTTNYSSASGTVSVTVTKATPTITTMPTASAISYGQALSSSTLSGGASTPAGSFAFTTPTTQPVVGTASQGVTFTPTDTTNYSSATGTVSVTVTKATPTITTWPTASAISYGQALSSSTLTGGASTPAGSFAFTAPTTQPVVGTASQGVTFTPTDATNYSSASGTVSVTVTKATPTITTWPTASAISYGQALSSSTLSGGASTPAGSFAFTTPTTQPVVGTASQGVTFTPTDTTNYSSASGTVSVTVTKATPTITTWPTASAISYGQALSSSTLSGGASTPAGSFAFTTPTTQPVVGTASQGVTFTPTDTTNYSSASGTVSVTVTKATPTITTWPTASAISYGQALSSSTLSGGASTPAGSFAFTAPTTQPSVGTASQGVTFTPTDTTNYSSASGTVSVTVTKATPTITTWPTASAISYGQALSSSTLSGGASTPAGSFAFTAPTTQPSVGTASQGVTFTPTDTTNYSSASGTVSVTVTKATPTITTWPTASAISYGQALSSSTLTGGASSTPGTFAFTTPSTQPVVGTASQGVTFTPTDTTNYSSASGTVSVTVTGAGIDLIESAVSAPASASSGQAIQVTDTVTNVGGQDAGGSITGFYLSTDGVTKGTYIGYRYVGALAAGASNGPVTTTVTLPPSIFGTYYLMACANYANQVVETSTANNCTASAPFTITGADLIESTVSVLTGAPVSGGSLQVSDTVLNQGGNANASMTGFYLSINGTTKGAYLGYRYVDALSAGGNSASTRTLTLPTNLVGTYQVIACANYNNQIVESSTTNNCTASAAFTVAAADLIESTVSVLTSAPASGGSLQVSDTVLNQGGGNAGGSMTGFYLSTNGVTKGAYLGYRYVGALSANITSASTKTLTLPVSLAGTYYVIACADYSNQVAEANKANNCTASSSFVVAGADLTESAVSILTTAPAQGGSVQVTDTAANQGAGTAGMSMTGFYLSSDGLTKGAYLGYRYVGTLTTGANSGAATTTLRLPASATGTYYVISCANYNNQVAETDETNNCTASSNTMLIP